MPTIFYEEPDKKVSTPTVRLSKPSTFASWAGSIVRSVTNNAREYSVHGIDVSGWSGTINFDIAASHPNLNFMYFRALHGKSLDAQFHNNVRGCNKHGIPWAGYIYVKPEHSWEAQADEYIKLMESVDWSPLNPVVDVEDNGGLTKSQLNNWLIKFIAKVEIAAPQEYAMIYCRSNWWDRYMPRNDWAKRRKLWVAQWNLFIDEPTDLPNDWDDINNPEDWVMWQYWHKLPGPDYGAQSASIDGNRYNGNAEDFEKEFGVAPYYAPTTPPPQPELPSYVVVNTQSGYNLNIRDSIWGTVIGELPRGLRLSVKSMGRDTDNRIWYEVEEGNQWVASWLVIPHTG